MNAPFSLTRERIRKANLCEPDEVTRIEAFVAESGGSVFTDQLGLTQLKKAQANALTV